MRRLDFAGESKYRSRRHRHRRSAHYGLGMGSSRRNTQRRHDDKPDSFDHAPQDHPEPLGRVLPRLAEPWVWSADLEPPVHESLHADVCTTVANGYCGIDASFRVIGIALSLKLVPLLRATT